MIQLLLAVSRLVVYVVLPTDQIAYGQFMVESLIRRLF